MIDPNDPKAVLAMVQGNPQLHALLDQIVGMVDAIFTEEQINDPRDIPLVAGMQAGAVELADDLIRQSANLITACKPGCSWCCWKVVAASAPEVLLLATVVSDWSPDQVAALIRNLEIYTVAYQTAPYTKRLRVRLQCPLLINDQCSVYSYRPLACAMHNSADAKACKHGWKSHWSGGTATPIVGEYYIAIQTLSDAITKNLERRGLPDQTYVLAHALHIALVTPDFQKRWTAGEDLLAPARWPS